MRITPLLAIPSIALVAACGDANVPNPQLFFTNGPETSTLDGIDHFIVETIDSSGTSKQIYKGPSLPTTIDMGSSGSSKFRATGFADADESNALARGETLPQDLSRLLGAQIPLFIARRDRTTIADGHFAIAPGASPKVAIRGGVEMWLWANPSSDFITTDAYSFAYWQRVAPQSTAMDYSNIDCGETPCKWQTLVMAGNYIGIAIANEWAIWVDSSLAQSNDYPLPTNLGSFANVAGGRVLPGANGTAVLVGGARPSPATEYVLNFASTGLASVMKLATPRAGAATLFEPDVGLVVVGGSSDGSGVERVEPGTTAFVALDYPADPVAGAALIREDATHVLRVGGQNSDGSPADTVRIDLGCAATDCAPEVVADLAVKLLNAQSFFDDESGDSILVGEDASGLTSMVRFNKTSPPTFSPIQVPDNQARLHATALQLPTRRLALVGGTDPTEPSSSRSVVSVVSY